MTPHSKLASHAAIASSAIARQSALTLDLNLPNLITLGRLLLVPVAVWLILEERYGAAFWVFIVAGVSDAADGYIAKRYDLRTRLGALLDPVADKLLLAGVYVTLGVAGQLPGWLVIWVVLRDVLIILGFVLVHTTTAPRDFGPLFISKVNTLAQIALVGFVLARLGLEVDAGPMTQTMIVLTAITTTLSGSSYLLRWARIWLRSEPVL
ncbi:MAG TPA: CDP-alcohol phosphatidyltransferase family protein [Stellaceae bacterium]|nr:CDP-alcohol phosphatidyltransferase family protein [Stellaceae bacterium]